MSTQFVVAVGYHHSMVQHRTNDPDRARERFRTALHHAVADWLRVSAKTPWPLAWKTADRVVAEKLRDPQVSVVYLTAGDLLRARDVVRAASLEHVRIP